MKYSKALGRISFFFGKVWKTFLTGNKNTGKTAETLDFSSDDRGWFI
jgi:hypothetical protein